MLTPPSPAEAASPVMVSYISTNNDENQIVLEIPKVYLLEEKAKHHKVLLESVEPDSLLRSQRMSLVQLYFPVDIAKESISVLGSVSCFQFRNLNEDKSPNQLSYAGELRQLEEAERRLALLVSEAELMSLWSPSEISLSEAESASSLVMTGGNSTPWLPKQAILGGTGGIQMATTQLPNSLQELCDQLMEIEKKIIQLKSSEAELQERRRGLLTRSLVLAEAERQFFSGPIEDPLPGASLPGIIVSDDLGSYPSHGSDLLGFVGGLIAAQKISTLEGILWRALRGHLLFRVSESGPEEECIFLVSAHGEAALAKVRRLAISLGASVISIGEGDAAQRYSEVALASSGLEELESVLASTAATKRMMLVGLTGSFPLWRAFILKERAIFTSLNMCQLDSASYGLGGALSTTSTLSTPNGSDLSDSSIFNGHLSASTSSSSELNHNYNSSMDPKTTTNDIKQKYFGTTLSDSNNDTTISLGGCLVAEGWTPTASLGILRTALERARCRTNAPIAAMCSEVASVPLDGKWPVGIKPLALTPPTSFKVTKVTDPFQELINAYGVPTYGEINPAIFILVTFPFLFGVMFGDVGHGLLLLLTALFLVINEHSLTRNPPISGDLWAYLFGGRYIILLMGLWSIYIGLIYNDCFSRSLNIFSSGWEWARGESELPFHRGVPFFGIDSAWITAENALIFLNAYKTKQALLLGMLQMLFGLGLSALNYASRADAHSLVGVFVPQTLFLCCTFGYLVLLFVAKWIIQTPESPSLLLIFVDMFLSPGVVDPSRRFYPGQAHVQSLLLVVALFCIPWMLLYRPLARAMDHRRLLATNEKIVSNLSNDTPKIGNPSISGYMGQPDTTNKDKLDATKTKHLRTISNTKQTPQKQHIDVPEFSLGEELVHSGIHTIEFVLASISNTASYLRLWALSLAHSQLSEVLWSLIAENASTSPLMGVFIFIVWFSLTVAILVAMEGLSAFLHALRLHWVEFNNKFYQGEGVLFEPFSIPAILSPETLRSFSGPDADI